MNNIKDYQQQLSLFAQERDWDEFHSPKNLTMARAGEAGELLEIFQWLTEKQSHEIVETEKGRAKIEEEVADIAIYLLRLCDKLNIDLDAAIAQKIKINEKKYPVDLAKGNATKYNERE